MLTIHYERDLILAGKYKRIIGIDEVGRGSWAGPLALGCFVLTEETMGTFVQGVDDSKKLSIRKRDEVAASLAGGGNLFEVKYANVETIDQAGVGEAEKNLIKEIVDEYADEYTLFLIDGYFPMRLSAKVEFIIDGDAKHYSIAAASIMAKVARDKLMDELSQEYPVYGFEKHKGYGTLLHRKAIETHGICPEHRKSYKPIKRLL